MYEKRLAWLVVVCCCIGWGCSADPNAGNQPDMSMDCGGLGAACCPGATCSSGACVGGVCQACGGPIPPAHGAGRCRVSRGRGLEG